MFNVLYILIYYIVYIAIVGQYTSTKNIDYVYYVAYEYILKHIGSFRTQTCPINVLVYSYTKSPGGHPEGDFRGGSGEGLFFNAEK